jgi:selenide, water dikinase
LRSSPPGGRASWFIASTVHAGAPGVNARLQSRDVEQTEIRLTDLTSCGGCAAKYPAIRLEELLSGFAPPQAHDLLVGLAPSDDAAVYRLDDGRALVFTLDFFPPIVDDPADYGAIAATNALNDVFAMGGRPLVALSVAAFPDDLPTETVGAILGAAGERVREAGGVLAGGHTLLSEEPTYGLAVVGTVHPERVWRKGGARPGDALYLTKPLGTGLVVHGWARGLVEPFALEEAVHWMKTLSRRAAALLEPFRPSAVTDVTGFGLAGHAVEVAERSGVRLVLEAEGLPALESAVEVAEQGERTGGDQRNRDFGGERVDIDGVADALVALAFDPQTAGGLLVSIPPERAEALETAFSASDLFLRRVGAVEEGAGVLLH